MTFLKGVVAGLVAAALFASAVAAAPLGVLVHINSDVRDEMRRAVQNAINLDRYYNRRGETVPIEIVINGGALPLVTNGANPASDLISEIRAQHPNISFALCETTLRTAQKRVYLPIQVAEGVTMVEAGVGYLADRQAEGWAYLKP